MIDTQEDVLVGLVRRVMAAGAEHWPGLRLEPQVVRRYLGASFKAGEQIPEDRLADLYLAYACLEGVPGAIESFHRRYLARLESVIRRIDASPAFADEVQQKLAETLFVAPAGKVPKIAQYKAQGPIEGWLAIAAHRIAMRIHKGRRAGQSSDDDALARAMGLGEGPEMAAIGNQYKAAVSRALKRAVGELSSEDKVMLKIYHLRGVTTTAIAKMKKMSQPTVSRRLKQIRLALRAGTERFLADELTLSAGDLEALFRMACSQIDLSLSKMLGETTTSF